MRLTFPTATKLSSLALYTDKEGWSAPEISRKHITISFKRLFTKAAKERIKKRYDVQPFLIGLGSASMLLNMKDFTKCGKQRFSQLRKIFRVLGAAFVGKPKLVRAKGNQTYVSQAVRMHPGEDVVYMQVRETK
jgi:hypothetical protein